MSVKLEELKPGTVAIESGDGAICIVTELRQGCPAWPVLYVRKQVSGTVYKGRPESFKAVIGNIDLNAFQAILGGARDERKDALSERRDAMLEDQPLFGCPDNLKGLKIGDRVKVNHGFKVVEAVYEGYNHSRPKYPVLYSINGKRWKGAAVAVVGKVA